MMKRSVTLATGVILASGVASIAHGWALDAPKAADVNGSPVLASQWRAAQRPGEFLHLGALATGQTTHATLQIPAIAPAPVNANDLLSQARLHQRVETTLNG